MSTSLANLKSPVRANFLISVHSHSFSTIVGEFKTAMWEEGKLTMKNLSHHLDFHRFILVMICGMVNHVYS